MADLDIINGNTYTRKEVAEKLHITLVTLDKYIKDGKLEAVKVGSRKVLITETALKNFINNNVKTK